MGLMRGSPLPWVCQFFSQTALADAGEHGFDGTHEFIGIELQRLKGLTIRQDGWFVLDFSSFVAGRGSGDSLLEHRLDPRVNSRVVDVSGDHDTKADVGKFLEKLGRDDEFHGNIPPQSVAFQPIIRILPEELKFPPRERRCGNVFRA